MRWEKRSPHRKWGAKFGKKGGHFGFLETRRSKMGWWLEETSQLCENLQGGDKLFGILGCLGGWEQLLWQIWAQ